MNPAGLAAVFGKFKTQIAAAAVFSGAINVLALTGSVYMLQVYDRVLPSQSVPTLIGFSVLLVILYLAFGLLDYCRSRLLSRVGQGIERSIREPVLSLALSAPKTSNLSVSAPQAVRDMDTLSGFAASAGPTAFFDLPWMPIYLILIYFLHPVLGIFATVGGALLIAITAVTEIGSRAPVAKTNACQSRANAFGYAVVAASDAILAMGMHKSIVSRWQTLRDHSQQGHRVASDLTTAMGGVSKTLRMLLQSGILGLGAYLAIGHELSAGSIIAASIVMSRALAPVEIAIANWKGFASARQSYHRLSMLLDAHTDGDKAVSIPAPRLKLDIADLSLTPPGATKSTLQDVTFSLEAGDGLGVIGPSAAGKSTLIRGIVGVWTPDNGTPSVRLDGATLDQWDAGSRGRHIGYLPQEVALLEGTIAENIARFDLNANSEEVISAARLAGVHEMILRLEHGYETEIEPFGSNLSAGQRQQIGLARALFGNPFLLVLDEPNSNLDTSGDAALISAIRHTRERGGIVIVVAHRPSVLNAVNKILVLSKGTIEDFGPREKVFKRLMSRQVPSNLPPSPTKEAITQSTSI